MIDFTLVFLYIVDYQPFVIFKAFLIKVLIIEGERFKKSKIVGKKFNTFFIKKLDEKSTYDTFSTKTHF